MIAINLPVWPVVHKAITVHLLKEICGTKSKQCLSILDSNLLSQFPTHIISKSKTWEFKKKAALLCKLSSLNYADFDTISYNEYQVGSRILPWSFWKLGTSHTTLLPLSLPKGWSLLRTIVQNWHTPWLSTIHMGTIFTYDIHTCHTDVMGLIYMTQSDVKSWCMLVVHDSRK